MSKYIGLPWVDGEVKKPSPLLFTHRRQAQRSVSQCPFLQ